MSWSAELARLGRLARKELRESLRDRRAILTLLLMPLLLYPLLAIAFLQLQVFNSDDKARPTYTLGFADERDLAYFEAVLRRGERELLRRNLPASKKPPNPLPTPPHLEPLPDLRYAVVEDLEESVRSGAVDLAVRPHWPAGVRTQGPTLSPKAPPAKRGPATIDFDLLYKDRSARGVACARHVEDLALETTRHTYFLHLQKYNVPRLLDEPRPHVVAVHDPTPRRAPLVPALLPLILVLMTMTGAVYPAIDLTAGERERGTLEVLVAAPIPRWGVLFAKYVAVLTVAVLTALVNLTMMTATLYVSGLARSPDLFPEGLSLGMAVQVLALLFLFALFFSAVLLIATSFARSFKEAQAYLIPLVLLALLPGMLALLPGLSLEGPLAVVPLLNIVLLARDLLEGSAGLAVAGVVVATTLLYAAAAISVAARLFGTEAVLSESAGWGDLFRRAPRPSDAASPSAALLCLALMFPAFFLLVGGLGQLDLPAGVALALMVPANLFLFAAMPGVSAWAGRVRLEVALALRAPPLLAWPAALLLGLCLWPFAHELIAALRALGVSTLRPQHVEVMARKMAEWRALLPALVVFVLGVVPPVLEEWFFRGYLFSALEGREGRGRGWVTVLSTAALFALFHLLMGAAVAVERLAPSFLLGAVLGWLRWRTGSVWPAVVLHVAHNTTLVLLGLGVPGLEALGLEQRPDEHLPAWLLGMAGAGVAAGLALAWAARRAARRGPAGGG